MTRQISVNPFIPPKYDPQRPPQTKRIKWRYCTWMNNCTAIVCLYLKSNISPDLPHKSDSQWRYKICTLNDYSGYLVQINVLNGTSQNVFAPRSHLLSSASLPGPASSPSDVKE